jgi:hypothetical protein
MMRSLRARCVESRRARFSMSETVDRASWKLLADFLGYELVRIDGDDGAATSGATMRRPDGSIAYFRLEERDMRTLVNSLLRPAVPR